MFSEKTITTRLAGLREKRFANIVLNLHKHQRWIYLKVPGEPSEEAKPQGEALNEKTRRLQESLKKAIVFGTIDFNVLIQKLKESPYLDEVEDNSIQFVLTGAQMDFLNRFKRYKKEIDCQIASFPEMDYQKLINAIEESFFLQGNNNLSLKWCLSHAQEIMSGKYKTNLVNSQEQNKNFTGRNYASDEINSLFQSIDDIII